MDYDNYFNEYFTFEDFFDVVDSFEIASVHEQGQTTEEVCKQAEQEDASVAVKSPRRRTFGAQIAELRDEIEILKQSVEIRDNQLLDMYYMLYNLIKN